MLPRTARGGVTVPSRVWAAPAQVAALQCPTMWSAGFSPGGHIQTRLDTHTQRGTHRLIHTDTHTHTHDVLSGFHCLHAPRSAGPHAPPEAPSTLGCRCAAPQLCLALVSDPARGAWVPLPRQPSHTPSLRLRLLLGPAEGTQRPLPSPSPHVEHDHGPGGSSDGSSLTVLGLGSWHGDPRDLVLAFPSFLGSAASILCLFPGVCPLPR